MIVRTADENLPPRFLVGGIEPGPRRKINSSGRKYAYVVWELSDDGKRLSLRNVKSTVIPKEQKDSARVAELLKENAKNPELFGEEIEFSKEK